MLIVNAYPIYLLPRKNLSILHVFRALLSTNQMAYCSTQAIPPNLHNLIFMSIFMLLKTHFPRFQFQPKLFDNFPIHSLEHFQELTVLLRQSNRYPDAFITVKFFPSKA
mmetsp:Transcript_35842/g.86522  ORF Transcript_35842/g.86522 Transcript_35842/m.86522 type:complete len:109 (-) Transcript_35842:1300-1626(-)